jgi:hypothetical protein
MPRRSRQEQRHLNEQDCVGTHRADRKEQEELAGLNRSKTAVMRAQRMAALEDKEKESAATPRRVARPGKPLKRP